MTCFCLSFLHLKQFSQQSLTVPKNNSVFREGLHITVGDKNFGILLIIHSAVVTHSAWRYFWWRAHVVASHSILANKHIAHEHVAYFGERVGHSILVPTGVRCIGSKVHPLSVGTLCKTKTTRLSFCLFFVYIFYEVIKSSQPVLYSTNKIAYVPGIKVKLKDNHKLGNTQNDRQT